MQNFLIRIRKFFGIKWRYLFHKSYVYVDNTSCVKIGDNVRICNSKIHLTNGSSLEIGDNVLIENTVLIINDGKMSVGNYSVLANGSMPTKAFICITHGTIYMGHHNRIRAAKIWIRFKGNLVIGNYVNINEYSEIRCDESIELGHYVEISYFVKIWDTNTHEFESIEERRRRWEALYLKRDVAVKPKTKSVFIGNDIWIGNGVTILKGCIIGDGCILGVGAILSNVEIEKCMTVVNDNKLKCFPNNNMKD